MTFGLGDQNHYGNEWTFYICRELGCALYYRDTRPVITTFPPEVRVWVVPLSLHMVIGWLGTGDEGWDRVMKLDMQDFCFPVDLWSQPPRLDPQISRTCSEEMFATWNCLIQAFRSDF